MKVKIKMMLRYNKELLYPSEVHDIPKSQALLMIKNGFAQLVKKSEKVSCMYCGKEVPIAQIGKHEKHCKEQPLKEVKEVVEVTEKKVEEKKPKKKTKKVEEKKPKKKTKKASKKGK